MDFITAEQFRCQTEEVKNIFLKWWKPSIGDLFEDSVSFDIVSLCYGNRIYPFRKSFVFKKLDCIPLFTEGQLRRFIENKCNCLLDVKVENLHDNCNEYTVTGWEIKELEWGKEFGRILFEYHMATEDLLQLYWEIACSVAKDSLNN